MPSAKQVKQPFISQTELNKIDRYHRERKKSGAYAPWVTVRQSHTQGRGQILSSHKADHQIHLLSEGELLAFLKLEHEPDVTAIFEQWPLPILETMDIAKHLNVAHPGAYMDRVKHNGKTPAKTMTTDLLAIRRDNAGKNHISPYSFKYEYALSEDEESLRRVRRTRQKIAIEQDFWLAQGAKLEIIHETHICETTVYNLEYLRGFADYPSLIDTTSEIYQQIVSHLQRQFIKHTQSTLARHLSHVARELELAEYHVETVFKHAAYHDQFALHLDQRIERYLPLPFEHIVNPYAYR